MAGRRKNPWLDPNKEGKSGEDGENATVLPLVGIQCVKSRILKVHNL